MAESLDLAAIRRHARHFAVFSDERGQLSGHVLSLLDQIEELQVERDRLRCAAGIGRSYGLDCDKLERLEREAALTRISEQAERLGLE